MDNSEVLVSLIGDVSVNWLDIVKNVFVPILTSFIAFGGIALSVYFTSKDNKEKQKNELLIKAKEEILKERLKYLKEIQEYGVVLTKNFKKIRFYFEELHTLLEETVIDDKEWRINKNDFNNLMIQFKVDSTALLMKLNPDTLENQNETKIEIILSKYEELCYCYFNMLEDKSLGINANKTSDLGIKLEVKSFINFEIELIYLLRKIGKETWTQAQNEFRV